MRVVVQEMRFELPDGFVEMSLDMWSDGHQPKHSRFAIVVARRALGGRPLDRLIERDLAQVGPRMGMTILERGRSKVGGAPSVEIRTRLRPPGSGGLVYQRLVGVAWEDIGIVWTATSDMRHRTACDAHLDATLAGTVFRKPQ